MVKKGAFQECGRQPAPGEMRVHNRTVVFRALTEAGSGKPNNRSVRQIRITLCAEHGKPISPGIFALPRELYETIGEPSTVSEACKEQTCTH